MSDSTSKIPSSLFTPDAEVKFVQEHDSGFVRWAITKELTVTAAASGVIANVPPNSFIDGLAIEAQGNAADFIATGTALGIGITGDLDKFDEVAEASINENDIYVSQTLGAVPVAQAARADVILASTNGSGVAAGTFTGTFNIVLTGRTFKGFGA